MPPIKADPERLREFSDHLQRFNQVMQGRADELRVGIAHLGSTWCDPQFDEFRAVFEQTVQKLGELDAEVKAITPRLLADVQLLEELSRLKPGSR